MIDAIYFAWISLIPSSVDIGFSPVTDFGKVFTMLYLVVGVGVMLGLLVLIAKAVLNVDNEESIIKEKLANRKAQRKEK